jgi:hypothetical protein
MKTKVILLAFMFPATMYSQSDLYTVIKVQGEIQRLKTGNILSTGEEFESNENLRFKTNYSRAAVISPNKGRFILTAGANLNKTNYLQPMNNLSSRAIKVATSQEVIDYFVGDILFLGSDTLKFDNSKLKLATDEYFSVSYLKEGVEVNDKLTVNNGFIVLNTSTFFNNNAPEAAKIKFYSGEQAVAENEFTPVFANDSLISEVKLIIANSAGKPRADVVLDVAGYLNDFYGKISQSTIDAWLKQNFSF